jgi:type I restriction enzyme R subunit
VRKARQYRGGYQFAGLKELVRELRQKQTSAEALLWELFRNRQLLGFKFRRQHQFGDYVADFYCHEVQLVIEWTAQFINQMNSGITTKIATNT